MNSDGKETFSIVSSESETLSPVPVPAMVELSSLPDMTFDCLDQTEPMEVEALPMQVALLTLAVAALRERLEALEDDRDNRR